VVVGVNGQDGSYLAQELLARGGEVIGIGRQPTSRHVGAHLRFRYVPHDLRDAAGLNCLLEAIDPEAIYHLAAVHGASGFVYEDKWRELLSVNIGSLHTCLEAIRKGRREAVLFYANSIKSLCPGMNGVINEDSLRNRKCLYSIAKNASADLIDYYRAHHGVRAWCGYMSNHDSPRRADNFFLPRLVAHLAATLGRGSVVTPIHTLDFTCDWGSSQEFMRAVADLTEAGNSRDLVLASGVSWTGRMLARKLGNAFGLLDDDWMQVELRNNSEQTVPQYRIDISGLKETWGRVPVCDGLAVSLWIACERFNLGDAMLQANGSAPRGVL
jgi:GDPmannose 4,6-dehydratase